MANRHSPSSLLPELLLHDPFDDPFFFPSPLSAFLNTHHQFFSTSRSPKANQGRLRIEEVPMEGGSSNCRAPSPIVEHPDEYDQLDFCDRSSQWRNSSLPNNHGTFTFSSSSFCYDGPQGAYYAASKTRRGGPQGVVEEQFEEKNSTTCKHTKRMSRGLGNKGHSVTCQKDTRTGQVKEEETLHNLAQDEVENFERKWEQQAEKYIPGWKRSNNHKPGKLKSAHGGPKALPSRSHN